MVQDISSMFRMVRMVVLGTTMAFAVIVLGLGAAITNWTTTVFKGFSPDYFPYAALAIAIAALTLLTVPIMFFFSITRKGAFVNLNAVEVAWTGVLWVLWLATGSFTASNLAFISDCGDFFFTSEVATCRETQGVAAFGFLTWILLFAYNIFHLTLVVRQQMRGTAGVWTSFVTETDFGAQGAPSGAFASQPQVEQKVSPSFAPQYPPTPQHQQQPVHSAPPMSAHPQV
ncbi:hypothetical protein D9613_010356 [Agrocybe pediades]|uniref:MARVEL domain-containing protein n=1 Tax=Agrocybe pediades TaxID=84607 RepID=A0A8H4QFF6_9AGAR|nr:hypothetical protein D9613_010356 [Agrocybe pediades]